MILLFADHCCLWDEKKAGTFVLYSSCVIFAAAGGGFARDVNSGVFGSVCPAYEAYVVKDVSLRMAPSLKPVDSSVALLLRACVSQFGHLVFAENEISRHTGTACEPPVKGLRWRSAPAVRVLGTGDAGPLCLEIALDSFQLGTFVASAQAALLSGCKPAQGAPQAGWSFQCIVWRSFDCRSWTGTEELSAVVPHYILNGVLCGES